jgi:hypothetical protein
MKSPIYGLSVLFLFATFYPATSFSQQQNATDLDLDATISDIAYELADYHYNLAKQELARGNLDEANKHFNLAGMTLNEIIGMVEDANLTETSREKLIASGPGNCIIEYNGTVMCLN